MADNLQLSSRKFLKEFSPAKTRFYVSLSIFATGLAFLVIILGAYTRLTDAGLGCPDWPGCYGNWVVQNTGSNPLLNTTKAWTEMIHRYLAGSLGLIIFVLAALCIRNRFPTTSKHEKKPQLPLILPIVLCILVMFQALLGMWTVTLKLLPLIVMAHLLGGLATLSLLWYLSLKIQTVVPREPRSTHTRMDHSLSFRRWTLICLMTLSMQLFLGGWTSANYAALACIKFPFCQAHLTVNSDFKEIKAAFRLTAAGPSKIGKPLTANELMIVHMAHRVGALLTAIILSLFSYWLFFQSKNATLRIFAVIVFSLLILQILLGILNVLSHLPLTVAVAHNGVAALLLLVLVTLAYNAYSKPRQGL